MDKINVYECKFLCGDRDIILFYVTCGTDNMISERIRQIVPERMFGSDVVLDSIAEVRDEDFESSVQDAKHKSFRFDIICPEIDKAYDSIDDAKHDLLVLKLSGVYEDV